ncbi:hypothetical protein K7H91_09085 [Martelella mediterranea]|uniref:hypothetical protein n=1 Tax=Martelella mediterranea TaxID=293089 RepID=UPI001E52D7E5|nr:hypothetical protein [Martelella mediterranea]MCD1633925.1 hypothetical protein [Martelella mediterranea]
MSGADAGTLVIVEKSSHCLSFYDRRTTERLDSIDLPRYSHERVVSADRAFAFIGHYGLRTSADHGDGGSSVTVVDLVKTDIAIVCLAFPERAGSGNLHSGDKWNFCLTSA